MRILDIFQNTASVRVDAGAWVDYMHIVRLNERELVNLTFGLEPGLEPMDVANVANLTGISPERIRKLVKRAFTKLRDRVEGNAFLALWTAA